jgi:hypothetical protein
MNRKLISAVLATAGIAVLPSAPLKAQTLPDSGLEKPYHVALGFYSASDTSTNSSTGDGLAAKFDYSFFRPTRHEAVGTLWVGRANGGGSSTWWAGSAEYRWRFGGHGIAYYGVGAGYLSGNGMGSELFTAGLGVDLGQFTIESRSLLVRGEAAGAFMVGYRF